MKLTRALILSVLIIGIGWPQQSRAEPIIFGIILAGVAGVIVGTIIGEDGNEEVLEDTGEIKRMLKSTSLWGIAGLIVSLAGVFFAGLQAFRQRKKKAIAAKTAFLIPAADPLPAAVPSPLHQPDFLFLRHFVYIQQNPNPNPAHGHRRTDAV